MGYVRVVWMWFFLGTTSFAQTPVEGKKYLAVAKDGIPVAFLEPVIITAKSPLPSRLRRYQRQWNNYLELRRKVRKVYPLAKECARIINQVNHDLQGITNKEERKKYLKRLEKELFEKYEDTIWDLTISEGKILVKLINRETGSTAYELIEEYKSTASARFWQLIAKVFGGDLKLRYDPEKERAIEMIVQQIENGEDSDWIEVAQ